MVRRPRSPGFLHRNLRHQQRPGRKTRKPGRPAETRRHQSLPQNPPQYRPKILAPIFAGHPRTLRTEVAEIAGVSLPCEGPFGPAMERPKGATGQLPKRTA